MCRAQLKWPASQFGDLFNIFRRFATSAIIYRCTVKIYIPNLCAPVGLPLQGTSTLHSSVKGGLIAFWQKTAGTGLKLSSLFCLLQLRVRVIIPPPHVLEHCKQMRTVQSNYTSWSYRCFTTFGLAFTER